MTTIDELQTDTNGVSDYFNVNEHGARFTVTDASYSFTLFWTGGLVENVSATIQRHRRDDKQDGQSICKGRELLERSRTGVGRYAEKNSKYVI